MTIVHPEHRCGDCEGTGTPLYHSPRDDGHSVQIVHACEHLIRAWYPDSAPADLAVHETAARRDMPGCAGT